MPVQVKVRMQKKAAQHSHKLVLLTLTVVATFASSAVTLADDLKLVVDGQLGAIPFNHFWQSTGFCPPLPHQSAADFDLSPDMVQNLAYIGAVPHGGIEQVRIHWLLDLVKVQSFSSGRPVYNFTALDLLIDLLHTNRLRPGFELMGSPSGIFTDMENKTQVYWWRDLVTEVAQRYIDSYGLGYVKMWNFETWNEPDCHDFDENKMTTKGFLNYYDACSEGLKAASPLLVFGGPGDGCDHVSKQQTSARHGSEYAEALFEHVVNGTNFFTGQKGVRLDFISLHRKGNGNARHILDEELKSMAAISSRYPSLAKTPFYNDEADPLVGWSKDKLWRATATYAAMAVKVIGQHQNILLGSGNASINYTLLSNDNGFLSFYPHQFTQRTLLARFQMNFTNADLKNRSLSGSNKFQKIKTLKFESDGETERTMGMRENYVTFVRKPIYAAMVLLAKLGDHQVFSELTNQRSLQPLPNDSYAGSVATLHTPGTDNASDSFQWAAIVYSSSDTSLPTKGGKLEFDWSIKPISAKDLMLAVYTVNEGASNPYTWWHDFCRKPDFPSLQQFAIIRKHEGPHYCCLMTASSDSKGQGPYRCQLMAVSSDSKGRVSIPSLQLQEPDILLLHLCQKSRFPPEQVTGVRMINITAGQVLIVWSDTNIKTKCIKTFEVEQFDKDSGEYKRINAEDTIVNLFVHATESEQQVEGYYRLRAVDYWERPGPCSEVTKYTDNL